MTDQHTSELISNLRSDVARLKQGHRTLKEAFDITPEKVQLFISNARALAKEGNFHDSYAIAGGLRAIDPDNPLIHSFLGWLFAQQELHRLALESCEFALQLDPACISAHLQLGELHIARGDLPSAINHLKTGLDLNPSAADAHAVRARSLLLLISQTVKELQTRGPDAMEDIKQQVLSNLKKKDQ